MNREKIFSLVFREILKENGMNGEEFAELFDTDAKVVEQILNAELPFETVREWYRKISGYKENSRLS